MEKKWLFAKPDCWFTQKELKEKERRIFIKGRPNINSEKWEEWTNEQRKEYLKEHKSVGLMDLLKMHKKPTKE